MKEEFVLKKYSLLAISMGFNFPVAGVYVTDDKVMMAGFHTGFPPTHAYYPNGAILKQQLIRWFEEVHNLEITTTRLTVNSKTFSFTVTQLDKIDYDLHTSIPDYPTILDTEHKEYPERDIALNEAFEFAFKFVKNKI